MSNQPRAIPLKTISKWIHEAAVSEPWRPGRHLGSGPLSVPETLDFHETHIQSSLLRARLKTFVRVVKPLRRLFRNQGAVNDSLIEAVHHLAAQNEEMMEEISDLRGLVRSLVTEMPKTSRREGAPETRLDEAKVPSAGQEKASVERSV